MLRLVRTLALVALLGAGALVSEVASATSMIALDMEEQAVDSTALVEAIVGEQTPIITDTQWYTDSKLTITKVVGGDAPKSVSIRQVGGTHNDRVAYIPGDARLVPGQRIVAFIRKVGDQWYFTALGQSVWHLDGEGPDAKVHRDIDHLGLYQRSSTGHVIPVDQSLPEYETHAELLRASTGLTFGGAQ